MAYCTLNQLEEFLTLMGGEITGITWPDDTVMERHIDWAAGEIYLSLQASDQASCSRDTEMDNFLTMLNAIGAMLLTEFDNARFLEQFDKTRYQEWKDNNLELIRTGKLAVCAGETGSEYPAIATAEVGYTFEAQANILINYLLRQYGS